MSVVKLLWAIVFINSYILLMKNLGCVSLYSNLLRAFNLYMWEQEISSQFFTSSTPILYSRDSLIPQSRIKIGGRKAESASSLTSFSVATKISYWNSKLLKWHFHYPITRRPRKCRPTQNSGSRQEKLKNIVCVEQMKDDLLSLSPQNCFLILNNIPRLN